LKVAFQRFAIERVCRPDGGGLLSLVLAWVVTIRDVLEVRARLASLLLTDGVFEGVKLPG